MTCCCCSSSSNKQGIKASKANSGNSSSKKSASTSRGDAPGKQRMNDRGDMDEDTKAVAWLRSRSLESLRGEDATTPKLDKLPPITMPGEPPIGMPMSFDENQPETNTKSAGPQKTTVTLGEPYPISDREVPLRPQNGNVLDRAVVRKTTGTTEKSNNTKHNRQQVKKIERFVAQVSPSRDPVIVMNGTPYNRRDGTSSGKKSIARSDVSATSSSQNVKGGGSTIGSSVGPPSQHATRKHSSPSRTDSDDRLSDVPSDVDSVTKERYLLACHLLKTTLIQKETALIPIEREFILSLLADSKNKIDNADDSDGDSAISQDRLSAIEKAALRLDQDPLFQTHDPNRPPAPSPLSAANLARAQQQQSQRSLQNGSQALSIPKHRHTATKKPMALSASSSPSSSADGEKDERTSSAKGSAASVVLTVPSGQSKPTVKSSASKESLVRFDGWSFHQPEDSTPFRILGADEVAVQPRVLTPSMMEAFRGFFPYNVSESNFWLKFSLVRDGASLATLLSRIRASSYTIIAVETIHGEVFGSFTGSPWRTGTRWFGSGEAFLWRLKKSRLTSPKHSQLSDFENEMEVYPYTGSDELIQYCTSRTMAVGGGDWMGAECSFADEPKGIGFMIDCDLQGGETNSCATFANPRLSKRASTTNEFSISNLEVWTLTPCLTIPDASKLEVQKLFVEENRL